MPVSSITGLRSGLVRPESVAFSTSGHLLGVSNSEGHSVVFYAAENAERRTWARRPSFTISNANCLDYVHDVVLSPSNDTLLAVARDAHTLSCFRCLDGSENGPDSAPLWLLEGEESGLNLPTSVAVHPSGECLAIANRRRNGITLYRRHSAEERFETAPFQRISEEDLGRLDLAAPHGLDFSPDGNSLVVAHKRFKKSGIEGRGRSAVTIFQCRPHPGSGIDLDPTAIKLFGNAELHSVSVHPSANLIAVSDEGFGVNLLHYDAMKKQVRPLESLPMYRIGSSVKGVGFTPDGNELAVTCDLNEILFFDLPVDSSNTVGKTGESD